MFSSKRPTEEEEEEEELMFNNHIRRGRVRPVPAACSRRTMSGRGWAIADSPPRARDPSAPDRGTDEEASDLGVGCDRRAGPPHVLREGEAERNAPVRL